MERVVTNARMRSSEGRCFDGAEATMTGSAILHFHRSVEHRTKSEGGVLACVSLKGDNEMKKRFFGNGDPRSGNFT